MRSTLASVERGLMFEASDSTKQIQLKFAYFGQIFAEYSNLPVEIRQRVQERLPSSVQALVAEYSDKGDVPTARKKDLKWSELAVFEDAVLASQDLTTLRRKAWHLRARFSALVGPEFFHAYQDSRPPDPEAAGTTERMLRADLHRIVGLTHLYYSLTSVRERIRSDIGWAAGVAVVTSVCVLAIVAAVSLRADWTAQRVGFLALVTGFGFLGAFVSFSRRLDGSFDHADPVIGSMRLLIFKTGAPYSLLSGGIFSVLLYLILLGGLLSGQLFPSFPGPDPLPASSADWAKMMVWAFIAGFAERLVPDTLDRLVGQAKLNVSQIGQQPRTTPADVAVAAASNGSARQTAVTAAEDEKDLDALIDLYQPTLDPSWHTSDADPNRKRFGGAAAGGGWELTATCTPDADHPGVIVVDAQVKKTDATAADLQAVRFFLSPDFRISQSDRNIVNGQASLRFVTHYPFVLGAQLNPGGPTLELDLESRFPADALTAVG